MGGGLVKCGQEEGVKHLVAVRKLVLFSLFQYVLRMLSMGDA